MLRKVHGALRSICDFGDNLSWALSIIAKDFWVIADVLSEARLRYCYLIVSSISSVFLVENLE